jgi:hypothetical protein
MSRQGALTVFSPNQNDPNLSIPFNLITINVDPTMVTASISVANIRCLNVIAGGTVKIQASSLSSSPAQQLMILNTSGSKPIFISLDNGGLVAGVAIYPLGSGSNLSVIFDGTNLNQQ